MAQKSPETVTVAPAPTEQTMLRIEKLSPEKFKGAVHIQNDFLGARKRCCGISYKCCPTSEWEFSRLYRKYPDKLNFSAVTLNSEGKVVGFIETSTKGVPRDPCAACLHPGSEDEVYVEMMGVLAETRGQGAGTKMLEWSESLAREKGAKRLTLGVVAGNPAIRLYERFGFVKIEKDPCSKLQGDCFVTCLLGCPHGKFGAYEMEKVLE